MALISKLAAVLAAASLQLSMAALAPPFRGKTSKFLLVCGARAAPRGRAAAKFGTAALAPSFSFGTFVPA